MKEEMWIILIFLSILCAMLLLNILVTKLRIRAIRSRMNFPSIRGILPLIMTIEGTGHQEYMLERICTTCLKTVHEGYCSDCGTPTIPARPFTTCPICLKEQDAYNLHCKKCGTPLPEPKYLTDDFKKYPFELCHHIKLNPNYKGEFTGSD